jgi:hypothetical protein
MDTVTYPEPAVAAYLEQHFVPVKLNLAEAPEAEQARPLVPLWTPTLVVSDGRGREVHREIGWLPPADFLPMLKLAHAKGLSATGRGNEALAVAERAVEEHPAGAFAAELLYWRAVFAYRVSRAPHDLHGNWEALRQAFPDSTWATRASFPHE